MAYIICTLWWLHSGFSNTGTSLQFWAKLGPRFSAPCGAAWDVTGHVCPVWSIWFKRAFKFKPMFCASHTNLTWPSHLATQLLLIHNHPRYTVCQRTSISHALSDCPRCLNTPVVILVCLPVPILICSLSPSALFYLLWQPFLCSRSSRPSESEHLFSDENKIMFCFYYHQAKQLIYLFSKSPQW